MAGTALPEEATSLPEDAGGAWSSAAGPVPSLGTESASAPERSAAGCPATSFAGSGTTSTTISLDCRVSAEFGSFADRLSCRLPGSSGFSGSRTHSPRWSAVVRPIGRPPSRTVTEAWGSARPAITAWPCGLTRTTSKVERESGCGTGGKPGSRRCSAEPPPALRRGSAAGWAGSSLGCDPVSWRRIELKGRDLRLVGLIDPCEDVRRAKESDADATDDERSSHSRPASCPPADQTRTANSAGGRSDGYSVQIRMRRSYVNSHRFVRRNNLCRNHVAPDGDRARVPVSSRRGGSGHP